MNDSLTEVNRFLKYFLLPLIHILTNICQLTAESVKFNNINTHTKFFLPE